MKTADILQVFVSGLAMGSVYTLMGKGLFITFLTTRALNFGQGDFLMFATFVSMALALAGWSPIIVIIVTLALLAVLGVVLEMVAVRPLAKSTNSAGGGLGWVLTTMGFGMILLNAVTLIWGKSKYYAPSLFRSEGRQVVTVFGAGIYVEELLICGISLTIVALLYWLLFRTWWGKSIAVLAYNADTASLLGIDVGRLTIMSYVVMAVLAGICGILIGPIVSAQAHMGLLYVLKGFAVVCIGGFTNPVGILIAGLSFGVVESFSNYFDSAFGDLYPFIIVLISLFLRPTGLFGEAYDDVR